MNARERFNAVMAFEPVDRPPLWEIAYWMGAVRRWYREGLPRRVGLPDDLGDGRGAAAEVFPWDITDAATNPLASDVHDFLGMDPGFRRVPVNNYMCPAYEEIILEDHGDWIVWRDSNGVTRRDRKDRATLPAFIGWPVRNREEWEQVKAERLQPSLSGRLAPGWDGLVAKLKAGEHPVVVGLRSGYYWACRNLLGDEHLLYMFYDDPALVRDIMRHLSNFWIALYDQVLDQLPADAAVIWEDICYKNGPLISPAMVREFILPEYKRLTAFFRSHGIKTVLLDTDGDLRQLIPIFLEGGITGLLPFEVNAGLNVVEIREAYPRLQILGGIDKVQLARGRQAIEEELAAKVTPEMLRQGGFIPMVDHSVPMDISWDSFRYYRERLREIVGAPR